MHGRRTTTVGALVIASVLAFGSTAAAQTSDLQTSNVEDRSCTEGRRAKGEEGDVCTSGSKQATEILDAVQGVKGQGAINGVAFGVWVEGKQVITGTLGEALPGVPATRDVHFRIGNTTETFLTTLMLMLVDDGELALDDPVSKFFPDLPAADQVTVQMLATSTSGYADYVTTDEFIDAFDANPFRAWEPQELIDIGMSQPPVFTPPGSSWAFSDTNFVLLGEILAEVGGKPVKEQFQTRILDEVGLPETRYTTTAEIPSPVLHAYSPERGRYEDATFWNISWATNTGNMTSNLTDMGKWAQTLGEGRLLSSKSHELQTGDENVGLGPNTDALHYAMGLGVSQEWIVANPQLVGYTGVVSYLPSKKMALVVNATFNEQGQIGYHYAAEVFNAITEVVSPDNLPNLSVQPRG